MVNRPPNHIFFTEFSHRNWSIREIFWLKYDLDSPHRIIRFDTDYRLHGEDRKRGPYAVNKVTNVINDGYAVRFRSHEVSKEGFNEIIEAVRKNDKHPIVASDDSFTTTLCCVCGEFERNHRSFLTDDGITLCGKCMLHYRGNLTKMEQFGRSYSSDDSILRGSVDIRRCIWVDPYIGYYNHPTFQLKHWASYNTTGKNYESAQRARTIRLQMEMNSVARWMRGDERYSESGKVAETYKRLKKVGRFVHRWFYSRPNHHGDMDGITYGSIFHADWKYYEKLKIFNRWFFWKRLADKEGWRVRPLPDMFRMWARMNSNTIYDHDKTMKELMEKYHEPNGKTKILRGAKKMWREWTSVGWARSDGLQHARFRWHNSKYVLREMMRKFRKNDGKFPLKRLKGAWKMWEKYYWKQYRFRHSHIKIDRKRWFYRHIVMRQLRKTVRKMKNEGYKPKWAEVAWKKRKLRVKINKIKKRIKTIERLVRSYGGKEIRDELIKCEGRLEKAKEDLRTGNVKRRKRRKKSKKKKTHKIQSASIMHSKDVEKVEEDERRKKSKTSRISPMSLMSLDDEESSSCVIC